ncbi:hypothetical protein OF83DRAFT_1048724 [Amylostereum chailletii]|nr:hypothetical protein OF83DRAFT_1048724 [Amylostereum chailletii]
MTSTAPEIKGLLYRALIAHPSVAQPPHPDVGDSTRLAVIGRRIMAMVATDILSRKTPLLSAQELELAIEQKLDDYDAIEQCVAKYQLREEIIGASLDLLKDPQETKNILHSWIAATYQQHGLATVQAWIGPFIDPSFDSDTISEAPSSPGPSKRSRIGDQFVPPQPSEMPPPTPPNPLNPAQPQATFLPQFNQLAAQKHVTIEWGARSAGPPHAPIWDMECKVNGMLRGRGTGPNKQLAKEQAAREAFSAMGWGGAASTSCA